MSYTHTDQTINPKSLPQKIQKQLQTSYHLAKTIGIILLIIIALATFISFLYIIQDPYSQGAGWVMVMAMLWVITLYLYIISPIIGISLLVLIIQLVKLHKAQMLSWKNRNIRINLILHILILTPALIFVMIGAFQLIKSLL